MLVDFGMVLVRSVFYISLYCGYFVFLYDTIPAADAHYKANANRRHQDQVAIVVPEPLYYLEHHLIFPITAR